MTHPNTVLAVPRQHGEGRGDNQPTPAPAHPTWQDYWLRVVRAEGNENANV